MTWAVRVRLHCCDAAWLDSRVHQHLLTCAAANTVLCLALAGPGANALAITLHARMHAGTDLETFDSIVREASTDREMKPIPGGFLRMPSPEPHGISVVVNGITSACADDERHCAFEYSADATPEVTSMEPAPGNVVTAGDTITVTGTGLAAVSGFESEVLVGSVPCESVQETGSTQVCTLLMSGLRVACAVLCHSACFGFVERLCEPDLQHVWNVPEHLSCRSAESARLYSSRALWRRPRAVAPTL
jgi:IPT/TIG domain